MKKLNRMPLSRILLSVALSAMLFAIGCEEDVTTPPTAHFEPEGLVLTAGADTIVYYFQGAVRAGDTLRAPTGNNLSPHYRTTFIDADRQPLAAPADGRQTLGWTIAHNNVAELYRDAGDEWNFHIRGKDSGVTTIVLRVLHEGHADFTTTPIPLKADPSFVGEAAGIQVLDEESGDTLAQATSLGVSGSLPVRVDSTTNHMVLYFLDDEGIRFQPPAPAHAMEIGIIGPAIVEVLPEGALEPWAFRLRGIAAGSTKLRFSLLHEGTAEFTSLDVDVVVSP